MHLVNLRYSPTHTGDVKAIFLVSIPASVFATSGNSSLSSLMVFHAADVLIILYQGIGDPSTPHR